MGKENDNMRLCLQPIRLSVQRVRVPSWAWNAHVVITDAEAGNRLRESSVVKVLTEAGQATDRAAALSELCSLVTYPH